MSALDIYDEAENLISSDEYSEDDDDLMNAAISSRNTSKSEVADALPVPQEKNKITELKLLLKRKKFASIYKKRSIKWLNNKQKREQCKEYLRIKLGKNVRQGSSEPSSSTDELNEEKVDDVKVKSPARKPEEISIILEDTDIEESPKKNFVSAPMKEDVNDLVHHQEENASKVLQNNQNVVAEVEIVTANIQPTSNKRARSPSPTSSSVENNQSKKYEPDRSSSTWLYKEINAMFPKYDEVVGGHIKSANSTMEVLDENMTRILLDIQTLNEVLQTKEIEWNRLLHLKRVKEEILTRLVRKKHLFELQEKQGVDPKYTLHELKELELYLSESNPSSSSNSVLPTTVQQLIENRANMKKEDLEKERNNTNRLQSILVSNNLLPRIENSNNHFDDSKETAALSKGYSSSSAKSQQLIQSYQYLENRGKSNIGRQGPFKDVKSIIADFRQKHPEVVPRVGKRIKLNEHVGGSMRNINKSISLTQPIDGNNLSLEHTYDSVGVNYSPTLEKLLSASSRNNDSMHPKRSTPLSQGFKLHADGQKNYYRLQNLNDDLGHEVSITPVTNEGRYFQKGSHENKAELLRSALHTNSQQNVYLDGTEYGKQNYKDLTDNNSFNDNEMQCCQECKTHEARFVCAGCGNQWYCSRSCQISAWDKHSDSCNE